MKYLGHTIDFSEPKGADALFAPTSLHWQVFKNPVVLGVGGIAAVMLELAEPRVRHGVWDHSSFRTKPFERMKRTGTAAMITVYAPADTAKSVIDRVGRMHSQVKGVTPCGQDYRADDPDLLSWVQVTASYGFVEAYARLIGRFGDEERSTYYAESAASSAHYGASNAPRSLADQQALFERFTPLLEPSDILQEFIVITKKALPGPGRFTGLFVRAAVDLLPEHLIDRLDLHEHRASERSWNMVKRLAKIAERRAIPGSPPVQASKRMGLPGGWLHRKQRLESAA